MRSIFNRFRMAFGKLESGSRNWKRARRSGRMDDGYGSGGVLGMRQRNLDPKSAGLVCQAGRQPMEEDGGSTIDVACNLDLSPADTTAPDRDWSAL